MKKIFGLTVLLAAVIFSSCSLDSFTKKGSVDFAIPIAEIVALRNEIEEETVVEKEEPQISDEPKTEQEYEEIFRFLAQIKGNKGYHQIRYEYLDDTKIEELDKATFNFSFGDLPANQQYKVMIDVYSETIKKGSDLADIEGHALLVLSGDKDNIVVAPGETTYVEMFVEETSEYSYSNFDIILEYKEGELTKTRAIKLNSPETIPVTFAQLEEKDEKTETSTYKFYFKDATNTEEDNDAFYLGYKDQKRSAWKELTKISFKLKEESHFWGFDFYQAVREYDEKTEKETVSYIPLSFDDDGVCDVTKFLNGERYPFPYPLSIKISMDDATIECSGRLPCISLTSITFAEETNPEDEPEVEPSDDPTEEEPEEEPKEDPKEEEKEEPKEEPKEDPKEETDPEEKPTVTNIEEEIHGSLLTSTSQEGSSATSGYQQLVFNKRADSNRYIYDVSLKNALNGKSLVSGDTVVFVMKVASTDSKPVTFNQFYYELRTEDWAEMNDTDLYAGNECINVDDSSVPAAGYYTFVMPLNFIQDPKDYNTVLFFFDGQAGGNESSIALKVQSLDYYIFPAESKSFVFGLGKNWSGSSETYPYRYEFKKPLVDAQGTMYKFKGGETVSVALSGTVKAYNSSGSELSRTNFVSENEFTGEIYDGADYTSAIDPNWKNFHPLSNTAKTVTGNVTSLLIQGGAFSSSGTYVFVDIQQPFFDKDDSVETLPAHDYQFQCTSTCENPSVLLVIENFKMVTTVTESD